MSVSTTTRHWLRLLAIGLFLLPLLTSQVQGAPRFTARLNLDGDLVQITYTLQDATGKVGEPVWPDFQGLNLVSGPAVGTSYRIVNGVSSQEKTWSFSFLPTSEKAVQVGPAKVVVNGATLGSGPLTVPGRGEKQRSSERPVRLSFEVEPRRPVVGQAVRLRLRLDFSVPVRGYDQPRLGSAPGFVVETLEQPAQPQVGTRTVDGQSMNTAVLGEWLLFPVREGPLHLEPVTLQVQVEEKSKRRGRDPFDFFGGSLFNQLKTLAVTTDPLTFDVKSLPAGAPASFQGAVGSFTLAADVDKQQLAAGEALTLSVTIQGAGNVTGLELPAFSHSPDLERYDTRTDSQFKPGPKGQQGRRTFKTLFVPRAPGEQRIDVVQFSFFDPAAGVFRTLSAGPWTVTVEAGSGLSQPVAGPAGAGRQVTSYGEDIRQALPAPHSVPVRQAPPHHRLPWLLGLLGVAAWLPGCAWVARRRERQQLQAPALRARTAHKRARNRLKSGTSDAAAQEEILRDFLADRLDRSATGLTLEEVQKALALREAPVELRRELDELWRRLEFQRYGGGQALDSLRLGALLDGLEAELARQGRGSARVGGRVSAILLLTALLVGPAWAAPAPAATAESRFESAREAYGQGDAATAARGWQALVDEGHGGFELYYNLGNAWYRQGDTGRAVLNWERARHLRPLDRDVRANLEFIRPRLADRLETPVRLPIWNTLDALLAALPAALLAWGGLLLAAAAALVMGRRYLAPDRKLGPAARLLAAFLAAPAALALLLLLLQDYREAGSDAAVILADKVEVRAAPVPGSTAQFDLHAGTLVERGRAGDGDWVEIGLPDGRSGWVPAASVESLNPGVATSRALLRKGMSP
jgi:hypothetical protein